MTGIVRAKKRDRSTQYSGIYVDEKVEKGKRKKSDFWYILCRFSY